MTEPLARRVSDDVVEVELNAANLRIKNNHLYLRGVLDFFPADALGGSSDAEAGAPLTLRVAGLDEAVETDIDQTKQFFRRRAFVRRFFEAHDLAPGDIVRITRLADREYHLAPAGKPPAESRHRYWLKNVHGLPLGDPGWHGRGWVSDPPQPGKPTYERGDRLVIYLTNAHAPRGIGRLTTVLEVRELARWDRDLVELAHPGEGDAYPWVTDVDVVASSESVDLAPPLADFSAIRASQGPRKVLEEPEAVAQVEELIQQWSSPVDPTVPSPSLGSNVVEVDVEQLLTEKAKVERPRMVGEMTFGERELVLQYAQFLTDNGHRVTGLRLADGSVSLRVDLFDATENELIEAKLNAHREDVRSAIGQLADYARFIESNPSRTVLLGEEPRASLRDLLVAESITLAWRSGDSFERQDPG